MSTPSRATLDAYDGRFSNGRTATAVPAAVRLGSQGIEIAPGVGHTPLVWPYGELTAASPIGSRADDALLSCRATPGATLFVADRSFVGALADRASHLTAASQRWRFARPLLAVCAVVALAVALWVADASPARGLAGLLPSKLRQSLGRQVIQSMSRGHNAARQHIEEFRGYPLSTTYETKDQLPARATKALNAWGLRPPRGRFMSEKH